MLDFLDGAAATDRIRSLVESSRDVRLAVAFWGTDAATDLGLEKRAKQRVNGHSTLIICNLRSGGTNPDEIEKIRALLGRDYVKQCDTLHGKVYLFDDSFVLGSSNASANGLALQGREVSGWYEANVITDSSENYENASKWLNSLPSRIITNNDLIAAKIAFRKHRQALTESWPKGITLFGALVTQPERFMNKNIFITFYSQEFNSIQERDLKTESELEKNRVCDVDGVGYELKPSSSYVGFWVDEDGTNATFDGFFRTRDHEWTNGRNNYNKVWFCERIKNIIGIKSRGSVASWNEAIIAANKDIVGEIVPDEPIDIVDFYHRYFEGNPALNAAVEQARERFGV